MRSSPDPLPWSAPSFFQSRKRPPPTRKVSSATGWCSRRFRSRENRRRRNRSGLPQRRSGRSCRTPATKSAWAAADMTWKAHQTYDFFIDFLQSFGRARRVRRGLRGGLRRRRRRDESDACPEHERSGQSVAQRQEVFNFTETRTLEKDTDRVEVTLAKGQNVLVLKVDQRSEQLAGLRAFPEGRRP